MSHSPLLRIGEDATKETAIFWGGSEYIVPQNEMSPRFGNTNDTRKATSHHLSPQLDEELFPLEGDLHNFCPESTRGKRDTKQLCIALKIDNILDALRPVNGKGSYQQG